MNPPYALRPEPVLKTHSSFDHLDMQAATVQRVARLGALFVRRAWIESQIGERLDEMACTLALLHAENPDAHAPVAEMYVLDPSESEMDLPSDPSYSLNFLSQFDEIYQNVVAEQKKQFNIDVNELIMLWDDSKKEPDPQLDILIQKINEAAVRQKTGVGSKDFEPLVSITAITDDENGQEINSETIISHANEIPAAESDSERVSLASQITEEAFLPEVTALTLEDLQKALALNTLQIRQTIQWQWDGAPKAKHARIGVYQFLNLMKLSEERLQILKLNELDAENLRQNRSAWFNNKTKIERILFGWPVQKQIVFLNTLSLKKTLHIYELCELRKQILHMTLNWPLGSEPTIEAWTTVRKVDRLLDFLLTFATD